ncbi:hypothetical protein JCM8547_005687 [Rhodosporidiobolus lusitaniae]
MSANASPAFPAPATMDGQVKTGVQAASQASNAATVAKRLQSELMALMMSPPAAGITAFPESDSDMTFWRGRLSGAEGTVYEGHTYAISLRFPNDYPYAPPTVRFESTLFHPNIDLHGNVCLDILKASTPSTPEGKWSPALSVSTILVSLQSLLGEPNNDSPLNVQAAQLWDDQEAFKRELAKHYRALPDEDE